MSDPLIDWRDRVRLLAGPLLVGLGLRMLLLGGKSLWFDEAYSLTMATAGPPAWWGGTFDPHPPLYWLLLRGWMSLGRSEFTLRLSSALLGALCIPPAYLVAEDLAGPAAGRSTAWLVALSPLLVWYSQELRSYSLLVLLGLAATSALVRLVVVPKVWSWLLFVVAMTAALYTHYAVALLLPVQLVVIAIVHQQGRASRRGLVACLMAWPTIVAAFWPWLASGRVAMFFASLGGDWYPWLLVSRWLHVSAQGATGVIVAALVLAVVAAVLASAIIARRGDELWRAMRTSRRMRLALVLLFLVSLAVSVVPRGYTPKKFIVVDWPFGLVLAGALWPWQATHRRVLAMVLACSLAGSLINILWVPKDQWREAVAYIRSHDGPDDIVWLLDHEDITVFDYYASGALPVAEVAPPLGAGEALEPRSLRRRVWFVYSPRLVRYLDPDRTAERWLSAHGRAIDSLSLHGLTVTLYQEDRPRE